MKQWITLRVEVGGESRCTATASEEFADADGAVHTATGSVDLDVSPEITEAFTALLTDAEPQLQQALALSAAQTRLNVAQHGSGLGFKGAVKAEGKLAPPTTRPGK